MKIKAKTANTAIKADIFISRTGFLLVDVFIADRKLIELTTECATESVAIYYRGNEYKADVKSTADLPYVVDALEWLLEEVVFEEAICCKFSEIALKHCLSLLEEDLCQTISANLSMTVGEIIADLEAELNRFEKC